MKKLLLLLPLALTAATVSARQISEAEALAIAADKLPNLGQTMTRVQAKDANSQLKNAPLYMFNSPRGGFAIVAGDDSMPNMIVAYSPDGILNLDNCSPAMKAWLDEMSAFIAAGDFTNASRFSLDFSTPVAPLIKTKWDQGDPYNMLTPLSDSGKHCPTGCGATALAQIMNYWQYPKEGGLCEHSYNWNGQTLSVDFRQSRYDWDNMVNVYDGNATKAQKDAVAKLMYDCGVALDMEYDEESSNATALNTAQAVVDIFGYSPVLRLRTRDVIPSDAWYRTIMDELDEACPVLYLGFTESNEGHAFVCDGYDSDGLFHINWGWSGYNDGYFDLDTLDPEGQGIGGAASGQGFSTGQMILTGLQPPHDDDKPAVGWEMATYSYFTEPLDAEGSKFNIQILMANAGYRPFAGSICAALFKDGKLVTAEDEGNLKSVEVEETVSPGEVYKLTWEDIDAANFEDGKYTFDLVASDYYNPKNEQFVALYNEAAPLEFEIKDGKLVYDSHPVILVGDYNCEDLDLYVTALDGVRSKYANLTLTLLNNSGIPYTNGFSIKLIYKNGVIMDMTQRAINLFEAQTIEPGETVEIECPIYYNVASEVKLIVEENPVGENNSQEAIFQNNEITFVSDDVYHELIFADEPGYEENDGKLTFIVPVASCLGNPKSQDPDFEYEMERQIECVVFDPVKEEIAAVDKQTYSGLWHEAQELVFNPEPALENGTYIVAFIYQSAPNIMGEILDLNIGIEEGIDGFPITVNSSANNPIINISDNSSVDVYSINGTRMADINTLAPGIYISRKGNVASKIIVK